MGPGASLLRCGRYSIMNERIDKKISSAQLPPRGSGRTWAGKGSGTFCSLCGQPITGDEVEYEIEWEHAGLTQTAHLHLVCYQLWK
jgi:hypothetical protein